MAGAPLDVMKIQFDGDIGPLKAALREAQQSVQQGAQGITQQLDGLNKKFDDIAGLLTGKVTGAVQGFAAQAGTLGQVLSTLGPIGVGVAAAIGAVAAAAFDGASKLQAAQEATLKLNAVLVATGNNVGMTAQQINALAGSISKTTLASGADVRDAATAFASFGAAAYTDLGRVLKAGNDLSAVIGGDLKTNVLALAKAFEDPEQGLAKLRRAGVSFTETQKDMIKAMAEAGDKAGAISKILEVVESRVGGAAEAQASGLSGALSKNAKAWGGLSVAIAEATGILDILERKAKSTTDTVNSLTDALKKSQSPENKLAALDAQIADVQKRIAAAPTNTPEEPAMNFGPTFDPGSRRVIGTPDADRKQLAGLQAQRAALQEQIAAAASVNALETERVQLAKQASAARQDEEAAAERKRKADEEAAKLAAQQQAAFDKVLVGLERQFQLVGKTAEEQERMKAQWAAEDAIQGKLNAGRQAQLDTDVQRLAVAKQIVDNETQAAALIAAQSERNQKLNDYIAKLQEEARLSGISKELLKEQTALLEAKKTAGRALTEQEETAIRNALRLREANETAMKAAEDRARQFTQFWDRAATRIGDGLADALIAGFDRGQSGMQLFMDAFKRLALQSVAEVISAQFFRPAVAGLFGSLGLGSGAVAGGAAGGGGLLSGLGSLGGLFSGASSLFGGTSLTSFLPSIPIFNNTGISGIGSFFGLGGGSGAGSAGNLSGAALGEFQNMQIGTMGQIGGAAGFGLGNALGVAGGAFGLYQASQAQSRLGGALGGGLSGAMIGLQLGGPIGAGIGAIAGGLFGGLMGGKPSVGPNGNVNIGVGSGGFNIAAVGADNGFDPSGIIGGANEVVEKLNQLIGTAGVTFNPGAFNRNQVYGVSSMKGQTQGDFASIVQNFVRDGVIQADPRIIAGAISGKLEEAAAQVQAQTLVPQLDAIAQAASRAVDSLTNLSDGLIKAADALSLDQSLSPDKPDVMLANARAQFEKVRAAAQDGDSQAAADLPNYGRALLSISQDFNGRASGEYRADYAQVQWAERDIGGIYAGRASTARGIASDAMAAELAAQNAATLAAVQAQASELSRLTAALKTLTETLR